MKFINSNVRYTVSAKSCDNDSGRIITRAFRSVIDNEPVWFNTQIIPEHMVGSAQKKAFDMDGTLVKCFKSISKYSWKWKILLCYPNTHINKKEVETVITARPKWAKFFTWLQLLMFGYWNVKTVIHNPIDFKTKDLTAFDDEWITAYKTMELVRSGCNTLVDGNLEHLMRMKNKWNGILEYVSNGQ